MYEDVNNLNKENKPHLLIALQILEFEQKNRNHKSFSYHYYRTLKQ